MGSQGTHSHSFDGTSVREEAGIQHCLAVSLKSKQAHRGEGIFPGCCVVVDLPFPDEEPTI